MDGPEYDVYRLPALERELADLAGRAVLDFRNVRYADSSCLTALVRALNRMRIADPEASMRIVNADANLRMIFRITGLDAVFQVE